LKIFKGEKQEYSTWKKLPIDEKKASNKPNGSATAKTQFCAFLKRKEILLLSP